MKIERFNENFPKGVKTIKTFDKKELFDIDFYKEEEKKFIKKLQLDIKNKMKINSDNIIFGDGISRDSSEIDDNFIWGIDKDANLLNIDDDVIFSINEINNTFTLFEIMERIIDERAQTYLYQKFIIENDTRLIPTIVDNLNARIKKEYPHLTSGKDLNLI